MSTTDDLLKPRRRLLFADGTERAFPDDLIGQWDRIKEILGIEYVQILRLHRYGEGDDWIMMIDEEAKIHLRNPIVNLEATRLFHRENPEVFFLAVANGMQIDVIVGDIAICRIGDFPNGEDEDDD